ncbi:MAG TPA: sugar transferase [Acidimicrobiales bacterium]|nr:sugar transferase [Acidimicrobiales bacterium]
MADVDLQRGGLRRAVEQEITTAGPTTPADADGKRDQPYRQWARRAVIGDVVAAGLAAAVARAVSFGLYTDNAFDPRGSVHVSYLAIGLAMPLVWPAVTALCGGYDLRTLLVGVEELRRVLRAGISLLALLGFVHFALDVELSRGYVGALVPLMVLFAGIWRLLLRRHIAQRQSNGSGHHNVVAVGPIDEVQRLCVQLLSRPAGSIDIVAYVADDDDGEPATSGPLSLIRHLPNRDAIKALHEQGVSIDLLVRAGRPHHDEIWALARRARELDAALAIAPHREDASANVAVSYVPLGNTPLLVVETPTLRPSAKAIKAVFDRVMAGLMVLVLSPVLIGIALLVLIRDGRPVLFRQDRIGRHGEVFTCLKFRTMHPDAESQLADLHHLNEVDGPLFKIRDDPRVTRLGRFLRDHSLDELPQLFNVLAGSMSIVGPRPPLPHEAATYNEREARRLLVKPGLTGLWQVEGRSDLPWSDGVYLDLLYVDHWSPLLDLVIIARTIRVVFMPSGAY